MTAELCSLNTTTFTEWLSDNQTFFMYVGWASGEKNTMWVLLNRGFDVSKGEGGQGVAGARVLCKGAVATPSSLLVTPMPMGAFCYIC